MSDSNTVEVKPCAGVSGAVRVPGDKSISHRLAMLGGLASGESVIRGFLCSDDCLNTLGALAQLGVSYERDGTTIRVRGTGGPYEQPTSALDLGNSGTGMRLLCGLLAGHPFKSELTGDDSLRTRPMKRIQEPLERMGARVELLGKGGRPPIRITGGKLKGLQYTMP
ncbi:MAG: 3-phosphoshikimate 1-carboxyvinyltransferase, partial [Lentisphaerae bacterium]|nr:3-phosphoshikimate 1-carboxyvinyltransferase [Lentisphaerota bacterium]